MPGRLAMYGKGVVDGARRGVLAVVEGARSGVLGVVEE